MRKAFVAVLVMAASVALPASQPALGAPKAPARTIADLKAAYLGETTAHAKYAAYAQKADQEGYKGAASIFRAASQAEGEHARNHKAVLTKLGVRSVTPGRYTKQPGTTRTNLQDAIKGETYEHQQMYPRMLKDAAAEKQDGATQSFTYANNAEKQHATLYSATLKNLEANRQPAAYYVCPVCGATYKGSAPPNCETCGTPREKFRRFR